jgi:hypothetical protein
MKLWLYWTMGQHMVAGWWAEFWSSLANAPHCSGMQRRAPAVQLFDRETIRSDLKSFHIVSFDMAAPGWRGAKTSSAVCAY